MNILVVQETDWMESLPLQSHHIMESLSKRGHGVRVVDFEARWKPDGFAASLKRRTFVGLRRTDGESSVSLIRPAMVKIPGIARLSSAGSQFKTIFEQMAAWCDVVVLYSVPTNGIQTILSAKLLSKPVLFHSFDVLHRMTGYRLLAAPTWALERFVYRRVDKILVTSLSLQDYMMKIGVPAEDVVLLPPAVNTDTFSPCVRGEGLREELGFTADDRVLLFSGWLYEFCGLDVIMKSLKQLERRVPRLKLVICGTGPLLEALQTMRAQFGLEEQVRILGKRPYDEMPSIVASADVCINPFLPDIRSNYAFPSKIVEYMAAGKPVVATDLPGTRSLLPRSSGVLLVPPERLVEALGEWLARDDELEEAGRTARKFCDENFSLDRITRRFEALLEELFRGSVSS